MEPWTTKSSRATQLAMAVGSLIVGVRIGYLGKRSNFQNHCYLDLKLRSGGTYGLFARGRGYSGSPSRATVEGWRERLETYLAATPGTAPPAAPGTASLATPGTAASAVPSDSPTVWDPLAR